MEPILFGWVEVTINAIEATVLGLILWQLFQLHRDVTAMLRVLRRIDRRSLRENRTGLCHFVRLV
jgi:hypothetical protein